MRACYGENYPDLLDAVYLWNERVERGIPAIASAKAAGTLVGKHMIIDIALMFDHWDIIDYTINEILAETPNDPHALFAKAVYGFEGVLPSVDPAQVPSIIQQLENVAPTTAKLVDETLAFVKMVWFYEYQHIFYASSQDKEVCEIGMNGDITGMLFPDFKCVGIPDQYSPRNLAIVVFGASDEILLSARVKAARRLAELYPQAVILATGGKLGTFDRSEGDLIKELMPEFADRVVVDRLARDTIGNSLAIAEYLRDNEIGNLLLVSSSFHIVRASSIVRGVLQRNNMHPHTYMVSAGNNVQAPLGTWSKENQAWLETKYGGLGHYRAIEIPMTSRDFARGAGLFTKCDFDALREK
ncbi:hypothetical protein ACA910_014933 [Epithemia clementina (nom. ined.)]